ncbi:MAG: alkaline phosphatase family protein [Desulfobacter sp.]|nr:alkaline phosphatase family protein [Desulfobacter sp.]
MIRFLFNLLICCVVITCPGCRPDQSPAVTNKNKGEPNYILIVSIDALHPEALSQTQSPNIYSLMKKGRYTLKGQSTVPPLTLLSHAAMFTGTGPEVGRMDNSWQPGEKTVTGPTIFTDAKSRGFTTAFFYAKQKLGYLVSRDVDTHQLDRDFTVELADSFFKNTDPKKFCFLHISGLDRVGPIAGWLSPEYMEELFFIDKSLGPLIEQVISHPGYLIIITSDHAGHGTIHGSDHPDDAKLPLVMMSDIADLEPYQGISFYVTDLRSLLKKILGV